MMNSVGDLFQGVGLVALHWPVLIVLMVGMFFRNRNRANLPGGPTGPVQGGFGAPRPGESGPASTGPVVRPQYDDRDVVSGGGFGGSTASSPRPRPSAAQGSGGNGGLFDVDNLDVAQHSASPAANPYDRDGDGIDDRLESNEPPATGGFGSSGSAPSPAPRPAPRRDDDVQSSGGFGPSR